MTLLSLVRETLSSARPRPAGVFALAAVLISAGLSGQTVLEQDAGDKSTIDLSAAPLSVELRRAVEEALRAADYDRAQRVVVDEINRKPESHELLALAGNLFFLDRDFLNAAIAFKKSDALQPLGHGNRFSLAMAYVVLEKPDWAEPELERLTREDEKNALYRYWLGRIAHMRRDYGAAADKFRQAIQLDPAFMKAHLNLALSLDGLGETEQALRSYHDAVRLNREQALGSPWPALALGTMLQRLGKFAEAEPHLREAVRLAPNLAQAHYQLGLLLKEQGKQREALLELEQATELDPSDPQTHYTLARLYRAAGERAKASAALQKYEQAKSARKQMHSEPAGAEFDVPPVQELEEQVGAPRAATPREQKTAVEGR